MTEPESPQPFLPPYLTGSASLLGFRRLVPQDLVFLSRGTCSILSLNQKTPSLMPLPAGHCSWEGKALVSPLYWGNRRAGIHHFEKELLQASVMRFELFH